MTRNMEITNLTRLRKRLERSQQIIDCYREDLSRPMVNTEQLYQAQNYLFNLNQLCLRLQFGEEIGDEVIRLASTMDNGLIKLLSQN